MLCSVKNLYQQPEITKNSLWKVNFNGFADKMESFRFSFGIGKHEFILSSDSSQV